MSETDGLLAKFRAFQERAAKCSMRGHPHAEWIRRPPEGKTGVETVEYWCQTCNRAVTREKYPQAPANKLPPAWVLETLDVRPSEFPIVPQRPGRRVQVCARCNQTAYCEEHHSAPRAAFEDDAETYPTYPLCDACHRNYHTKFEAYIRKRLEQLLKTLRREGAA